MSQHEDQGAQPQASQHADDGQASIQAAGFSTRAVHAGSRAELQGTWPSTVPIYATTTFLSDDAQALDEVLGGTRSGYVYGRYGNPTVTALEAAVSALEGVDAAHTVAFASGMAALHAALLLCELKPGDTVLVGTSLYGASHTLLTTVFARFDVRVRFADMANLAEVEQALAKQPRPRVLLCETVSNPLIEVTDLPAVCAAAHAVGALAVVDATFTPPLLLLPIQHGADIVVQSATKYLSGHGDVVGGMVTVADAKRVAALRQIAKLTGGILGPFEAFLILRGVRTLALRVARQCENALALAQTLVAHPQVARVHYPGLASHPQHALAGRLLARPHWGAMLAFEIAGAGYQDVLALFDALRLALPATTLGDVATEVSYPLMSSHREWSPDQLSRAGITPSILRVSAGIEDAGDIIADFEQALDAIGARGTR